MTVSNIGVLSMSAGENNPGTSNEGNSAADIPVLQLHLEASNAETLDVDSIAITMTGTINHATDVSAVKLYRDVNGNGAFDAATDYALAASETVTDSAGTVHFKITHGGQHPVAQRHAGLAGSRLPGGHGLQWRGRSARSSPRMTAPGCSASNRPETERFLARRSRPRSRPLR